MRLIILFIVSFLPWPVKRMILVRFFGWQIDATARIGLSLILARIVVMGPKSRIHHGVLCKGIDLLEMGEDSGIANFTFITGYSTDGCKMFKHIPDRRCELILGRSAGITSRHFVDCNGGVYVGDFATVAGIRTQILTHSIDVYNNRQDAKPIRIGKYCFVGTGCIFLPGSVLPDYSVLGAGSVLTKAYDTPWHVYAGSPARVVKDLNHADVRYFARQKHFVE